MQSHKLLLTSLFTAVALSASAQGTAFTYQGQLQNNGSPASGTYNLTFTLFNTNTSGVPIAGPVTNNAVNISNGLFAVLIDFGPGAFTGATNWLEITVATNGVNAFTTLTPRQQLTPVPYAIYAESASGLSGTLSASQLTSLGNANGGYGNFFVGPSGNSTTSGLYNTANGNGALGDNTSGSYNTANGDGALYGNSSGWCNTANGAAALGDNTSGSYNTADGFGALYNNTSGSDNIALGFQASINFAGSESSNIDIGNPGVTGENNTIRIGSGQSQTFIAGVINGDGSGLTGLDASQLTSIGNTNGGGGNFFLGGSGNSTNSGSGNTASGYLALLFNTSGTANTANGYGTLVLNTSGSWNTANGVEALWNNSNGSFNTADGCAALIGNTSGSNNIALGYFAGVNITTGSSNIEIGNQGFDGDDNIIRIGSGQTQTFIAGVINGDGAGLTNLNVTVNASQLTSIGNTNGGYANFFVGPSGNTTMNGWGNTANGAGALVNNTSGTANLADGNGALNKNTSGQYNTASGYAALYNNTIGWFNTANGAAALGNNNNGFYNTASGFGALYSNISGSDNTAIGDSALNNNTNGNDNIALGYQAGINLTTGSSNIEIGNQGFSTDDNIIRIGDGQTQTFIAGVINGDGSGLTSLNAANVAGTLAPTQIPNLDAAKITSGAMADARLSPNVALLNNSQTFSGAQTFSANVTATASLRLNGLLRAGSETGAAFPSYPPNPDGSTGLVIRRIVSTTSVSNSVVARTDQLTLVRDGTASGLNIVFAPGAWIATINATGISRTGNVVTRVLSTASPPPWTVVFSDSQKVVHYDISFGDIYDDSHTCHVVLDRYDDGTESDWFMVGTLTSTYNQ